MGSIVNKYRVHEVAKDFGVPTKVITEILTKYAQTPKNHMQVLDDRELSLIFEHLTQHNQVSGIQVIFAEGAKAAEKKQAEKPATAEKKGDKRQQAQPAGKPQQNQTPSKPMSRVPQTKVVDTRKATNVNLDKYDEKLQDMAERSGDRRDLERGSKEKFRNNRNRNNRQQPFSGKRKQKVKIFFNFVDDVDIPVISEPIITQTTYEHRKTA